MLSFPMKKPLDAVDLEPVVKSIDKSLWGTQGEMVMKELSAIRDKMRVASGVDIVELSVAQPAIGPGAGIFLVLGRRAGRHLNEQEHRGTRCP